MEEKTNLKLNVSNKKPESDNKLTYNQLNNACSQLFQQNQYLTKQLKELSAYNMFKRLDYLFEVIKNPDIFSKYDVDDKFVGACVKEIMNALTVNNDAVENNNSSKDEGSKGNAQA